MFVISSIHTNKLQTILQTLSWCQTSGKIQGGIYSDRTYTMPINSRNLHTHTCTAFQEALREDFLQIFRLLPRPLATVTAYWRRKERVYSSCGLDLGLEIGSSSSNPSHLRPIQELQSFIPTKEGNRELQSYKSYQSFRASNPGTKTLKTLKNTVFYYIFKSCNG